MKQKERIIRNVKKQVKRNNTDSVSSYNNCFVNTSRSKYCNINWREWNID